MKISELIEKLQHQQNLWGDLPIYHDRGGGDGFCFEEIEFVGPVHPQDENLKEDINQSPLGIKIV